MFEVFFEHLTAAFQSVRENHGCAGVDGVTIEEFEENLDSNLEGLRDELAADSYLPLPLLKIIVDKGNGEGRALCIPAVRDRVVQTAALQLIEPVLEKEFEDCSFAYRKGRLVRQAVYRIKEYYDRGYRWVVNVDIDAFFDSVDQDLLLAKYATYIPDKYLQRLVSMWLRAEGWDGESLTIVQQGIPQGSPISPILANLFLDELDEALLRKGYKLIRFSDDFIILCKTPKEAQSALELSKQVLEKLLLTLDEEQIVTFEQGFKYLGVLFIRSLIMTPFDKPKKERRVLYYPPPLDIKAYLRQRSGVF